MRISGSAMGEGRVRPKSDSTFPLSRVRERVGVRAAGVHSACFGDPPEHAVGVLEHIVVPEANDPPAVVFEPFSSPVISHSLRRVLSAIELDDERLIPTNEIGDEWPDRDLAAKLE